MGSLHTLHPELPLTNSEQNEIFADLTASSLVDYIESNMIETQSSRKIRNGTTRKYAPASIGREWEMHLRRFLTDPSINLGQLLANYHRKDTNLDQKKAIYIRLKNIGLNGLGKDDELAHEALMLGIAMMLKDNLNMETSLIHAFEFRNNTVHVSVADILEGKDGEKAREAA